jgi:hypothetical protein
MEELVKYFNNSIRGQIGYPETFKFKFSSRGKIELTPDQPSKLLELIKTNKEFKERTLRIIFILINTYEPNVYNIWFTTHGTDLIINYTISNIRLNLDTGIYSIICSYLKENDVGKFCVTAREVCKNNVFWTELIRNRFPEYYKPVKLKYNWEQVYSGLNTYEETITYIKGPILNVKYQRGSLPTKSGNYPTLYKGLLQETPDAFKYLLELKILDASLLSDEHFIDDSINNNDIDIFKLLYPIFSFGKNPIDLYYQFITNYKLNYKIFDYVYEQTFNKKGVLGELNNFLNDEFRSKYEYPEDFDIFITYNSLELIPDQRSILIELIGGDDEKSNSYTELINRVEVTLKEIDKNNKNVTINIDIDEINFNYENIEISRNILYQFIIKKFTEFTYDRAKDIDNIHFRQFNDYDEFKNYQKTTLFELSDKDILFYINLMDKIKQDEILNMDDEYMDIMTITGFYIISIKGEQRLVMMYPK